MYFAFAIHTIRAFWGHQSMRHHRFATAALIPLCAIGSLSVSRANADSSQGAYLGAGAGEYNTSIKLDALSGAPPGTVLSDFGYHTTAFQVFGGWRFCRYFALEGSYIDLGDFSDGTIRNSNRGFAPWVVGTLPLWSPRSSGLGAIEVFAKAGEYFHRFHSDYETGYQGTYSYSITNHDFVYGGGVGVAISKHLELQAEIDKVNLTNTYSAYTWFGNLLYRF